MELRYPLSGEILQLMALGLNICTLNLGLARRKSKKYTMLTLGLSPEHVLLLSQAKVSCCTTCIILSGLAVPSE